MILVRLVFQAKFGHAAEVVAGFKQGAEIVRSAGERDRVIYASSPI